MKTDNYPFCLFVGVDVSKAKLDFVVGNDSRVVTIANNPDQIATELIALIEQPQSTIVVVEATGGYERVLVNTLHQRDRTGRRQYLGGRATRTRPTQSNTDRQARWGGTHELRFRKIQRQTQNDRRTNVCAPRALHGNPSHDSIQPPHPKVLSTFTDQGQTQKTGLGCCHAKARDDSQHAGQKRRAMGR